MSKNWGEEEAEVRSELSPGDSDVVPQVVGRKEMEADEGKDERLLEFEPCCMCFLDPRRHAHLVIYKHPA